MASSPWQHAEKVLDGVRFDVVRVGYPNRTGGQTHREVVVPADAVVILPILDPDTVVLIRNERFAVGQQLWELPAGTIEQGEDPDVCAGRELTEETGYAARSIRSVTSFYTSPGFCTEKIFAYIASDLTHEGQNLDDTEQIEVHPVALDEALQMTRDGRIADAKSIALLLYYAQFERGSS